MTDQPTETFEQKRERACQACGLLTGHAFLETDCLLPHSYDRERHPPQRRLGFCCQGCITRHAEWLTEIVELYATLPQVIEPSSVTEDTNGEYQKPRKAPASPAPVRLDAWAMLHDAERLYATGNYGTDLPDVAAVLSSWAQNVYDALDITTTAPDTVTGAAAVLRARATAIAALPLVDEYDAEIRWVRRALRNAHGLPNGLRSVGRCPSLTGEGTECGGHLHADANGEMAVWCARCGRRFNERFLRLLGGMLTA